MWIPAKKSKRVSDRSLHLLHPISVVASLNFRAWFVFTGRAWIPLLVTLADCAKFRDFCLSRFSSLRSIFVCRTLSTSNAVISFEIFKVYRSGDASKVSNIFVISRGTEWSWQERCTRARRATCCVGIVDRKTRRI